MSEVPLLTILEIKGIRASNLSMNCSGHGRVQMSRPLEF